MEDDETAPVTSLEVTLSTSKSSSFQRNDAQFTISTQVSYSDIHQWWNEYKSGKTEQSYEVIDTITYEAAKREKEEAKKKESSGGTSSGGTSGQTSGGTTESAGQNITSVTADPSNTKFVMNSKPVSVTAAYNINNTNYLQLRAIASMLNGTDAQFDVSWDSQYAVIEPGKPYGGTITETNLQKTTNVRKSDTKFKMNGEVFAFSDARLIDGDTNYIQLSEF